MTARCNGVFPSGMKKEKHMSRLQITTCQCVTLGPNSAFKPGQHLRPCCVFRHQQPISQSADQQDPDQFNRQQCGWWEPVEVTKKTRLRSETEAFFLCRRKQHLLVGEVVIATDALRLCSGARAALGRNVFLTPGIRLMTGNC